MDPTTMEPKSGIWDSHINDGTTEGRQLGGCRSLPATRLQREKSVLARRKPRGGKRCIYMDSDEVKACRDLGFELEDDKYHDSEEEEQGEHQTHQEYYRPLERIVTDHLSRQYSVTSSSSGNSPIHNWRIISSPGDDPRDVKARLKVWAQAVALESHLSCITDYSY